MKRVLGKRLIFNQTKSRSNSYRVLLWIVWILGGVWLLLGLERGEMASPFLPTPTPTRTTDSYLMEAQAYFDAGKLDDPLSDQDAIGAYQRALQVDPQNSRAWAELARIQTYSSSLMSSDQERLDRLQEALQSSQRAVEIDPDNSLGNAIHAFVLDWNASSNLISADQREDYLVRAEAAANRAYLMDPEYAWAMAFYCDVLLDPEERN